MPRRRKESGNTESRQGGWDERQQRGGCGNAYTLPFRLRVVGEVLDHGMGILQAALVFGLSPTTVSSWLRAYDLGGTEGLKPQRRGPPERRQDAQDPRRQAVTATRRAHPSYGTRRIRDEVARREGLGVSETEVRRMLHEEGLLAEAQAREPREHPERRFERAQPNQLWQSDIFTFLLRRHERLYVAAFLDDHSRFVVGWSLAHHQKSDLVMEALRRGIAAYGAPEEILTDQGRQYTAWRGTTEFEMELRREGIRHIKSRPQHPQTLGKVERFWKTLWDEFLGKTVFSDFADCVRRLSLFIDAYNFQRPHQALSGLVPADRFFRAAPQVREAIEKTIAHNAMRLAHERPARKPFYLVGRLGDRELTIATAGRGLRVQVGDEAPQTIELPKEDEDEQTSQRKTKSEEPRDTEVADRGRDGRDGPSALSDDPERAQRRDVGERGGRAAEDRAPDVLSDGGTWTARDARRAGADDDGGRGAHEPGAEDRPARDEGGAPRAEQAPARAAALADAQGRQAGPLDPRAQPVEQARATLDETWEQVFAELEGDDEQQPAPERFDPDAGWRGRALCWERKLTGAYARVASATESDEREEDELHACPGSAGAGPGALPHDAAGAQRRDDGERGGTLAEAVASALLDLDASRDGSARGGDRGAGAGQTGALGAGEAARGAEREAAERERSAASSDGDDRSHPDSDDAACAGTGAVAPSEPQEGDGQGRRGGGP